MRAFFIGGEQDGKVVNVLSMERVFEFEERSLELAAAIFVDYSENLPKPQTPKTIRYVLQYSSDDWGLYLHENMGISDFVARAITAITGKEV